MLGEISRSSGRSWPNLAGYGLKFVQTGIDRSRSESDRSRPKFGRFRACVGRRQAKVGRFRANFGRSWPTSIWSKSGQTWSTWSILQRTRSSLVEVGPSSAESAPIWRCWSDLSQSCARVARLRPNSTGVGPWDPLTQSPKHAGSTSRPRAPSALRTPSKARCSE